SVAFHVTVVFPNGNDAGALLVIFIDACGVQLSVAVALPIDPTYVHAVLVPIVNGPGQVICGLCVSFTVTVNEQVAVLPLASVTLNLLVVVPTGNVEPLARPAVWASVSPAQLSSVVTV